MRAPASSPGPLLPVPAVYLPAHLLEGLVAAVVELKVVVYVDDHHVFRAAAPSAAHAPSDHLRVQQRAPHRAPDEHAVDVGRVKAGGQDAVVAQHLQVARPEPLDGRRPRVGARPGVDVRRLHAVQRLEEHCDQPRVLHAAPEEEYFFAAVPRLHPVYLFEYEAVSSGDCPDSLDRVQAKLAELLHMGYVPRGKADVPGRKHLVVHVAQYLPPYQPVVQALLYLRLGPVLVVVPAGAGWFVPDAQVDKRATRVALVVRYGQGYLVLAGGAEPLYYVLLAALDLGPVPAA